MVEWSRIAVEGGDVRPAPSRPGTVLGSFYGAAVLSAHSTRNASVGTTRSARHVGTMHASMHTPNMNAT